MIVETFGRRDTLVNHPILYMIWKSFYEGHHQLFLKDKWLKFDYDVTFTLFTKFPLQILKRVCFVFYLCACKREKVLFVTNLTEWTWSTQSHMAGILPESVHSSHFPLWQSLPKGAEFPTANKLCFVFFVWNSKDSSYTLSTPTRQRYGDAFTETFCKQSSPIPINPGWKERIALQGFGGDLFLIKKIGFYTLECSRGKKYWNLGFNNYSAHILHGFLYLEEKE